MAIYTALSEQTILAVVQYYHLGHYQQFAPLSGGTQNSNYVVNCREKSYVITVLESGTLADLNITLQLLEALGAHFFPVPKLYYRQPLFCYHHKPLIVTELIQGQHEINLSLEQIQQVAFFLARLHTFSNQHEFKRENKRNRIWQMNMIDKLHQQLQPAEKIDLANALAILNNVDFIDLPKGITHSDLFRDNLFFQQQQLISVIDFYDAAYDYYLYDVAVAINDCCQTTEGYVDEKLTQHFLTCYQTLRPFAPLEKKYWPAMQLYAAVNFWLLRLNRFYDEKISQGNLLKDPQIYQLIVRQLISNYQEE
ncbi:MAG: homoserine kinase [Legionellales bacterium]|nr:homoserine kinase [Legionellales bacterium]